MQLKQKFTCNKSEILLFHFINKILLIIDIVKE